MEGYTVDGERRHINSAFFTFRLVDKSIALPQLILETKVHVHLHTPIHIHDITHKKSL